MTKESLLRLCRYYKGEDECPHGVNSLCWNVESAWVAFTLRGSRNNDNADAVYLLNVVDEYNNAGLRYFEMMDDTPITLKALLFNRFDHWNEGGGFKEWYLTTYMGNHDAA